MKRNKGFTLVELLVVIVIIGILAMVAVGALDKNLKSEPKEKPPIEKVQPKSDGNKL